MRSRILRAYRCHGKARLSKGQVCVYVDLNSPNSRDGRVRIRLMPVKSERINSLAILGSQELGIMLEVTTVVLYNLTFSCSTHLSQRHLLNMHKDHLLRSPYSSCQPSQRWSALSRAQAGHQFQLPASSSRYRPHDRLQSVCCR